jgi:hypothetical protein
MRWPASHPCEVHRQALRDRGAVRERAVLLDRVLPRMARRSPTGVTLVADGRQESGRLMRDLAAILLAVLAIVAPLAIPVEEEPDEDLAWVDREIRRCEDGPRSIHQDTPEMAELRNERLERLRRIRARLVEGEIA